MPRAGGSFWPVLPLLGMLLANDHHLLPCGLGQESGFATLHDKASKPSRVALPEPISASDRPLPINLATALQLANVRPLDVVAASERIRVAAARLERARVLWVPTIYLGVDYSRHDGQLQDIVGEVFGTRKSSFQVGAGPSMVFALSDAIFAPLAARQVTRARQAELQTATNNSLLRVAEAYFAVLEARGVLAGAEDAARRATELARRAEQLAPELTPPVETSRARAELARRRQALSTARERMRTTGAELARLLRLDPAAQVEPLEPPHLQVVLVDLDVTVDELIALGLTNRPELASQQALVQAGLHQLRQEKLRPLIPSVLLRGTSTNPSGTLAGTHFGGGRDGQPTRSGGRSDFDIQVLWEWQNLGLGNHARLKERQAEHSLNLVDLFRVQDQIAADVVKAHAQVLSAGERLHDAEEGLKSAQESAQQNFAGLGQTKRVGNLNLLVIRPAEAVAAIQALAQAYTDYYGATADFNRAQFRLYRALGQPAQWVHERIKCDSTP